LVFIILNKNNINIIKNYKYIIWLYIVKSSNNSETNNQMFLKINRYIDNYSYGKEINFDLVTNLIGKFKFTILIGTINTRAKIDL